MTEEANIISLPEDGYVPNPKGLGWELFEAMKKFKDNIGQVCGETGVEETFGAMLERSIRTALSMQEIGIKPDDIVSLCIPNHFNSAIAWVGSLFAGCKISSIDPTFNVEDAKRILESVQPKLVFVMPTETKKIEQALAKANCLAKIVVFGETDYHIPFLFFLRSSKKVADFTPIPCKNIKDTVLIVFSSGTTGFPKGVCLNHYGLICQASNAKSFLKLPNFMIYISLYSISNINATISSIMGGFPKTIIKHFDVKSFWYTISAAKVTAIFIPPHQIVQLCEYGVPKDVGTSTLQVLLTVGSPITKDHILQIRKVFPGVLVLQSMGQTEICGSHFKFPKDIVQYLKLTETAGSVGIIKDGISAKIVDPVTEKTLGPNQVGELRMKSNFLLNGYYNRDSSECFDANGWFKTGDLMYYDEKKLFYFIERIREAFKFRHTNVTPAILEEVLKKHPAVLDSVVIGIPHAPDGDWPMGIVTLKNAFKNKPNIEEEILDYFNARVDDLKKLRAGLKVVEELPKTATGKIYRRGVKEMVLGG